MSRIAVREPVRCPDCGSWMFPRKPCRSCEVIKVRAEFPDYATLGVCEICHHATHYGQDCPKTPCICSVSKGN